MKLTNAEFALLSLLAEAPRHGYDLERLIEARGMRNWTEIGFSSIYFLLKKLEARGLIAVVGPAPASRRVPKAYQLTETGRAAHRAVTERALAEPDALYPAVLLGLANWQALTPAAARTALVARAEALAVKSAGLQSSRASQGVLPPFVAAMFDYSAAMIEAERQWLSRTTEMLDGR